MILLILRLYILYLLQTTLQLKIEAQKIMDKRLDDQKIPDSAATKKPDTSAAGAGIVFILLLILGLGLGDLTNSSERNDIVCKGLTLLIL